MRTSQHCAQTLVLSRNSGYSDRMKIYRDLTIAGSPDALERLRERLGEMRTGDWERSAESEARAAKENLGTPGPFVFSYAGDAHPAAKLWLFWKRDHAEVTNIVPTKSGELTHDEYNAMAAEFAKAILEPASVGLGLGIHLGPVAVTFDQKCTERVREALRAFSLGANKSTLNTHPMDAERWRDFVVKAHMDHASMDSELLADWLENADEWSADDAQELSFQYVRGRDLLRAYDQHRSEPSR